MTKHSDAPPPPTLGSPHYIHLPEPPPAAYNFAAIVDPLRLLLRSRPSESLVVHRVAGTDRPKQQRFDTTYPRHLALVTPPIPPVQYVSVVEAVNAELCEKRRRVPAFLLIMLGLVVVALSFVSAHTHNVHMRCQPYAVLLLTARPDRLAAVRALSCVRCSVFSATSISLSSSV